MVTQLVEGLNMTVCDNLKHALNAFYSYLTISIL